MLSAFAAGPDRDHDIAVKDSVRIAAQMTTQQIDEAEKLIQAWVPGAVLDD